MTVKMLREMLDDAHARIRSLERSLRSRSNKSP